MPTVTAQCPRSTKSCSSPGVSVPSSVACNGPSPSGSPPRYLREAVDIAPTVRIHGQMSGKHCLPQDPAWGGGGVRSVCAGGVLCWLQCALALHLLKHRNSWVDVVYLCMTLHISGRTKAALVRRKWRARNWEIKSVPSCLFTKLQFANGGDS